MALLGDIVRNFTVEVFEEVDRIHRDSFRDVMVTANDENIRMPVDTGALQDSVTIRAAFDGEGVGISGKDNIESTIESAPKFATYLGSWGNEDVDYALHQEFGTDRIPARAFARSAVAQWGSFVAKNSQPD